MSIVIEKDWISVKVTLGLPSETVTDIDSLDPISLSCGIPLNLTELKLVITFSQSEFSSISIVTEGSSSVMYKVKSYSQP